MTEPTRKPWKASPHARTCAYAGCRDPLKPGMQPLRLNGVRGYWHLKCFEIARRDAAKAAENLQLHMMDRSVNPDKTALLDESSRQYEQDWGKIRRGGK